MLVNKPNAPMHSQGLLPRHYALLFGAPLALDPLDIDLLVGDGFVRPASMDAESGLSAEHAATLRAWVTRNTRGHRGHHTRGSRGR
jgi:hypothetical protein